MDAAKSALIYLRLRSADSRAQPSQTAANISITHTRTPRHHKRVCGGKVSRIPGQRRSVLEQRNALSNSQTHNRK